MSSVFYVGVAAVLQGLHEQSARVSLREDVEAAAEILFRLRGPCRRLQQVRKAREIREDAAQRRAPKRSGVAGELQVVPVFHIGTVELPEQEALFPFFLRTADVDALWDEIGGGKALPELVCTDLAALVDALRDLEGAPGRPLVCAPLDGVDFLKSYGGGGGPAIEPEVLT